jgi:hypothetical protein
MDPEGKPLAIELDRHHTDIPRRFLERMSDSEYLTGDAIQLQGGNGYTNGYLIERKWRDARLTTIIGGTGETQRKAVVDGPFPRSSKCAHQI